MSHRPDSEDVLQDQALPEPSRASCLLLLTDCGTSGPVEVELVDYPIAMEDTHSEALVADSQCEV